MSRAPSSHPVRQYVQRVASQDLEEYPEWDVTRPLPKLPVPGLQESLEKYLLCIKPVVPDDQYTKTEKLVKEFGRPNGEGEQFQEKLESYAASQENWASRWWLDDMYMKARFALPVNSNPGMVFPRQHFIDTDEQLRYAARLISGILDYKVVIDSRSIPVDRVRHHKRGQPLCMEQYYRLFSSYRKPGTQKDSLVWNEGQSDPSDSEHIIVICKNQLFCLDVIQNHNPLTVDDLFTQLKKIAKMADEEAGSCKKVGILTSLDRTGWAKAREKMLQDDQNTNNLRNIETCIFVLCLDRSIPLSFNHQRSVDETVHNIRDDVSLALQTLHGQGSKQNSANRWYDKTMQFIVCEDGACGLNYEHSASEGIAVVQLIEHLLKYMEEVRKRKLPRMRSVCDFMPPEKLYWNISRELEEDIDGALIEIDRLISTLDLYVLRFEEYGKDFPKSQNMSPDAYIQLALQLTFYKVHHRLVPTYESASIRRFRKGRVDNIRASTLEALEWVKAMVGETETTDQEKLALLRKAMKKQTEILLKTILGYGFDNHLLGLRMVAEEAGLPTPEVFTDPSYVMSNRFTLSTSQVPTTMDAFMCYGPVVPDGYGVCYNPHEKYMLMVVTSFKHCDLTHSDFFACTLESSFMQMKELCLKANEDSRPRENGTSTILSNGIPNGTSTKDKVIRQEPVETNGHYVEKTNGVVHSS